MDRDTPPRLRLLAACAVGLAAMASYQAVTLGPPVLGQAPSADTTSARALSVAPEADGWRDALMDPVHLSAPGARPAGGRLAGPEPALSGPFRRLPGGPAVSPETRRGQRRAGEAFPAPAAPAFSAQASAGSGDLAAGGSEPAGRDASSELEVREDGASALAGSGRAPRQPPTAAEKGRGTRRAAAFVGGRAPAEDISAAGPAPSLRSRRRRAGAGSLDVDARDSAGGGARRAARRRRPILLSKLLGKAAIRPPRAAAAVPDLRRLDSLRPLRLTDGRPVPPPASASAVEALSPAALPACREKLGHWHMSTGGAPPLWHVSDAFGLVAEEPDALESGGPRAGWAWLARSAGRWWAYTAAAEPTWLRYHDRWWWRSGGLWFVLHEGEPWGYRLALAGRLEGFQHPESGAEIVYSADGRVVAVVLPGRGAVVYDAYTGAEVARLGPESIPKSPRPWAPASLSPP